MTSGLSGISCTQMTPEQAQGLPTLTNKAILDTLRWLLSL